MTLTSHASRVGTVRDSERLNPELCDRTTERNRCTVGKRESSLTGLFRFQDDANSGYYGNGRTFGNNCEQSLCVTRREHCVEHYRTVRNSPNLGLVEG